MDLPNTDIFDPLVCTRRWEQYATQQEINVYLTKQIDLNRKVLTETINTQKQINESNSGTLADHEKRIASLESGLSALDKAQSDLNAAFQTLQTDNNNFKSNVDLLLNQYQTTINLLQSNIDKISVSNEQLWSEVNNLKSQFDPDKLNAAIAGYDSVLKDAKSYADQINNDLTSKLNALSQTVEDNKFDIESKLNVETQTRQNEIANFEQEVRSALNQQTANINAFMLSVNKTNAVQRQWIETELERVNKRIDNLDNKVERYQEANANTHTDLKNQIAAARKEAADNLAEKAEELQGNIYKLTQIVNDNYESLSDEIKSQRTEIDANLASEVEALQEQIDGIKTSDLKQWDTINAILEAQNAINKKMEELNEFIVEQIGLVKSDIESVDGRTTELEKNVSAAQEDIVCLQKRTGFRLRAVAKAGDRATQTFDVGFGKLTYTIAAAQVQFSFVLNSGISGLISIPATEYGRFKPITNSTANAIARTTDPQFIEGIIFGYAESTAPVAFFIYYDPTTQEVTFLTQFPTDSELMPYAGEDASVVTA